MAQSGKKDRQDSVEKLPCLRQTTFEIREVDPFSTGNLVVVSEDILAAHSDDTVSLHVVVEDGDSLTGRLLDDVGEFVDEFHLVLTGSIGDSLAEIEKRLVRHPWARKTIRRMTVSSNPEIYVRDTGDSYLVGESLAGETLDCQFSGKFLLKDPEAVRNSCSLSSSADWRLHLEAADWVVSPAQIPMIVKIAKKTRADAVSTKHIREYNSLSAAPSWRETLVLNSPAIGWSGNPKPSLTGYSSQVCVGNVLLIGNRRKEDIADLHRDFKLLYHSARSRGWRVSPGHLRDMILILARMGTSTLMPKAWVTGSLFDYYSKVAGSPGDEARVRLMVGCMYEEGGDLAEAFTCYAKASELVPKSEIFFKLALLSFRQEKWLSCIDNYERGCRAMGTEQSIDSNLEMATRVLVAMSYYRLNDKLKAQEHIDEVSKANMDKTSVATVWKYIYEVR